MKIKFKIENDYDRSTETVEIELHGDTFDIPKADNRYLIGLLKNVAKLRGHKSAVDIVVLSITR